MLNINYSNSERNPEIRYNDRFGVYTVYMPAFEASGKRDKKPMHLIKLACAIFRGKLC